MVNGTFSWKPTLATSARRRTFPTTSSGVVGRKVEAMSGSEVQEGVVRVERASEMVGVKEAGGRIGLLIYLIIACRLETQRGFDNVLTQVECSCINEIESARGPADLIRGRICWLAKLFYQPSRSYLRFPQKTFRHVWHMHAVRTYQYT